jgi:hypothetical protein
MAIRRPSIYSPTWVFQDFLYLDNSPEQLRYLQVKWDGSVYKRVSETFDYSNPPYSDSEQRGGQIVAQIDYTINGKVITINNWDVDWRDEWPLRLAVNYMINCMYPGKGGYFVRVQGQEVYNQAGEIIPVSDKDPYAFWVSEYFKPLDNIPDDYLVRFPGAPGAPNPSFDSFVFNGYYQDSLQWAQLVVEITSVGNQMGKLMYWEVVGVGFNPATVLSGPTSGFVYIDAEKVFLKIPLDFPVVGGPYTFRVNFATDSRPPQAIGTVEITTG